MVNNFAGNPEIFTKRTAKSTQIYDFSLLCRVCASESLLLFEAKKLAEKKDKLNDAKQQYDIAKEKEEQVALLTLKIAKLKSNISKKRALLEISSKVVKDSIRRIEEKTQAYEKALLECELEPVNIGDRRILMSQNKVILDNTVELISKKQSELAQELSFIFPIDLINNELTICKLRLNLKQRMMLDPAMPVSGTCMHENSAAVGHATYLLFWLAKYTNTPLVYAIRPRSSEPLVYSQIAKRLYNSAVFPLYPTKGVDRPRYEYGIRLLFADVHQLQMALGKDDYNPNSILANLNVVLKALGVYA